jgi:hypothetical protein
MNMDNGTISKNYETGQKNARSNARKASRKSAMSNLDKLASQQKTNSATASLRNKFSGLKRGGGVDPTMLMFAQQAKQDADNAKAEREANAKQNREDAAIARRYQFFG